MCIKKLWRKSCRGLESYKCISCLWKKNNKKRMKLNGWGFVANSA